TVAELVLGAALMLGVATRYAALAGIVYVIIATALAHRYWEYPQAQQVNQYAHFLKNLAVLGGMLLLFVTGAGRFSLDAWLRRTRGGSAKTCVENKLFLPVFPPHWRY